MAKVICVAGDSGAGKTTSMRDLDPKSTFYIDCDKKGLPWKGWRNSYSFENGNYMATDLVDTVNKILLKVNADKKFNVVVIDTINGLMVADEMRRAKEKGFDKWVDLAACVWDLICGCYNLREDLTVIFTAHTQTERDDSGYAFTRIKTSGKKLDKIVLESKFTTVLIAKVVDGEYLFETHANNSTAKSPMGAFEDDEIPNNIVDVIKALEEF